MFMVLDALIPVIFLIGLGAFLQYRNFVQASFWQDLEKICYFILTPVFLISGFSSRSIGELPWQNVAVSVYVPLLIAAAMLWGIRMVYGHITPQKFTSMFQGGTRFNSFMALALSNGLYGTEGMLVCSLAIGFMIILINLMCVTTFSISLKRNSDSGVVKTVLMQLARNPLIIGCLTGVAISLSGLKLPVFAASSLEILGRACLPVALVIVGAAIDLSSIFRDLRTSVGVGVIQFCIKPLVATFCCVYLGLDEVTAVVVVVCMSVPTAPSSYILARQLGGDHQVMASMIAQQTLFALISLPATLWVFRYYYAA